jgi:hypothetical protein
MDTARRNRLSRLTRLTGIGRPSWIDDFFHPEQQVKLNNNKNTAKKLKSRKNFSELYVVEIRLLRDHSQLTVTIIIVSTLEDSSSVSSRIDGQGPIQKAQPFCANINRRRGRANGLTHSDAMSQSNPPSPLSARPLLSPDVSNVEDVQQQEGLSTASGSSPPAQSYSSMAAKTVANIKRLQVGIYVGLLQPFKAYPHNPTDE